MFMSSKLQRFSAHQEALLSVRSAVELAKDESEIASAVERRTKERRTHIVSLEQAMQSLLRHAGAMPEWQKITSLLRRPSKMTASICQIGHVSLGTSAWCSKLRRTRWATESDAEVQGNDVQSHRECSGSDSVRAEAELLCFLLLSKI